ncbi:MAG: hypothetical protein H0V80_14240, partial [Acidobacteria bacterium]|nr:hypothetical protein [Acidobacteriota bacterium]
MREAQHAYEALVSGRASAAGIAPARVKAVLLAMAALETSTTAASPAAAEVPADAPAPILAVVARGAPAPDPPVGEARDSDPAAQPALEAPLAASSDDEVDIEALLRLEDELEAAAGMPVGDVVTMPALCAPPVPPSRRRTSRRDATPEPDAADAPEPPSLATLQQERAHLERHFADIVAAIAPIDAQPAHPVSAHPEGAERSAAHSATAHETAPETAREIAVDSPAEVVAVEAPALPVEPEVIRLVPEVPATGGPLIDEIVRWRSMPIDEPSPIAATPIDELAPTGEPSRSDESAPTGVAAGLVDGDAPSACWWADALPWRAERAEDTSPPTAAEVSLSSAEVDVDSALTTEMWPIEVAAHVIEPDPWTGSEFGTAQVTTIPEGADSGASPIDDATASRAEAEIDVEPRLTAAALELEVADCISFGEDAAETTVSTATDGASAASDMEDVADVAGCTRLIETVDVIDAAAVEAPDDVVPMVAAPLDEVVEVVAEPDAVLEEVGGLELVLEAQSVAALDLQDAVDDVVEPEPFSLQAEPAVTQSMLNLTAIDDALPDAEGAVSAPSFDWSAAEPLDGNHPRVVAERDASVEPEVYGHLNVETAAAAGDKTAAVTPEVIVVDDPIEDDAFRKLLSESPDQADAPTAETAAAEPHQLELEQDLVVDPTIVEAIAQPESGALDAWVGTYSEVEVVATVPVAAVDDLPVASSEGVHGGDVDEPDARAATFAPLHVPFEEVSGFDADERDAHPLEVDADGLSAEEPVVVEHEPEPTWSSGEPVAPVIELVTEPAIEPVLELSAEPVAIEAPEVEDAEDTDAEAEAGRVAEPEPEPVLELEAELVAEPAAEVEAELEAEADAEVEHEAHPDLDLEPEPEPEPEAEVEVQADGDVDREVVEGSMAPAHGAAASAVTPAPPERKKRRRSRRKRGAVTTPLPVPARLPV